MDKDNNFLQMVINIRDNIKKESQMEKEDMNGNKAVFMKEIL